MIVIISILKKLQKLTHLTFLAKIFYVLIHSYIYIYINYLNARALQRFEQNIALFFSLKIF